MSEGGYTRAQRTLMNLGSSALAWGWPVLLNLTITPILVRGLGDDAYGVRGLVVSITGYFALLDLGLNGAVTKYLAEYTATGERGLVHSLLGTTLTTYLVFGLTGSCLVWLMAGWLSNRLFAIPLAMQTESVWAFRLAGIGFLLSMITWWGASIPAGLQRFEVLNGISLGFGTLTLLSSLAAVWLGYGLVGVIASNVLSSLVAAGAYLFAARRLLPDIPICISFDWAMFKRTIVFGSYMVAFRVFALVFAQLDRTLVGIWVSAAAVAYYSVPQSIASVVHESNAKLMQIVGPMASEFSATLQMGKMRRLYLRATNLGVVVGLALAMPVAILARPLLHFWLSSDYSEQSTLVLVVLCATYFVTGLTAMPSGLLGGMGLPRFIPVSAAISGLVGATLYVILIPRFGVNGAALAKLTGALAAVAYYLFVCGKTLGVPLLALGKIAVRPVAIASGVGALVYMVALPQVHNLLGVLMSVAVAAGGFGVACWLAGVFEAEEKRSVLRLFGSFVPSFLSPPTK